MYCKTSCDTPFLNLPLSDCKIHAEVEASPDMGLAQAWVPKQPAGGELYSACQGLQQGTIYPALDKPYACKLKGGCCDNG